MEQDSSITGKHSFHSGVDMAVELAAPVHATASGTVVFAGGREAMEDASSYGIPTALKRFTHIWQLTIRRRAKSSGKGLLSLCREHGQKHRLSSAL